MNTKLANTLLPTFYKQLQQLSTQQPCHASRCIKILSNLNQGTPYPLLGGKYLRCRPNIIRFKLGLRHRLLVSKKNEAWIPEAVLSHEAYNKFLNRRR
ncbi:MAG: hypothetical protein AXW15_07530 [Neptuniibacter sp. Phe_28]|jgi:hypothetical protein|nr:MAG: hypothetical protein AXW15_07530 [Neptuniibacter sp. Phe_28]